MSFNKVKLRPRKSLLQSVQFNLTLHKFEPKPEDPIFARSISNLNLSYSLKSEITAHNNNIQMTYLVFFTAEAPDIQLTN